MGQIFAGNWLSPARLNALAPTVVRVTADVTRTNTINLVDAVTVPVTAGKVYEVDAAIIYEAPTGNDMRLGFAWPSGSLAWGALGLDVAAGTFVGDLRPAAFGSAAVDQVLSLGGAGAGNQLLAVARGLLVVGGSGGDLRLRFAQNTATAGTSTIIKSGTTLRVTEVPA